MGREASSAVVRVRVRGGDALKNNKIRRMVGIAVITVQYEDDEVMQYVFDREGRVA